MLIFKSSGILELMVLFIVKLSSFALLADVVEPVSDGPSIFQTKSGPVVGISEGNVNIFLGIPYAKPPVGDLRFKAPQRMEPWTSVLSAVKPTPICYQQFDSISSVSKHLRLMLQRPWSEDCLHLNIWAPNPKPEKAPVVFFIHGGGFTIGSGLWMADGTALVSKGIVVVTINYRLGVFGFFNLDNTDAPGNVGLMDQHLALRWVRENIDVFGGDPEKITLAGMSAGSASVGYHLLSPKSEGLFKKALMMSGAPTNWWAYIEPEKSVQKSKNLLESLGCKLQDLELSLQCLRQRHPEDVIDSIKISDFSKEINFVPTVDGEFITENPSVSVASGKFNTAEVIIGTAQDEGVDFFQRSNANILRSSDGRLFRSSFVDVIQSSRPGMSTLQAKVLDVGYTDWSNPTDPLKLRDAAKDVWSDSLFNCHIDEFALKLFQSGSSVYRYAYNYKMSAAPLFLPSWAGVAHGLDQAPLLGPEALLKQFGHSAKDKEAFERYRMHIAHFVRFGNPNFPKEELQGEPEWPRYDSRRQILNFGDQSSVGTSKRLQQCALWLELLPLLDKQNTC